MPSLAELTDSPYTTNAPTPSLAELTEAGSNRPRVIINTNDIPSADGSNVVLPEVKTSNEPSKVQAILDKLFGLDGQERYQLWPEKVVREGLSAAHDVATGEIPQYAVDPVSGDVHTSPAMIKAGVDMSSLAGSGGLAGVVNEAGVALGSTPFLRPALKYGDKLFKGKEGQQHLDVIPSDLYPTFQKQAMSGQDISNFNFGFLNHKGQFMDREAALKYAVENGLVQPEAAKFGALTSTLMADSSKPGVAIEAMANTNKPFYSAVENALTAAKQPKADAQQWLSFLKNQPGVKQEELQHLGLDKLSGSITKDDLLKAVQEGQPQIKEVVKGNVIKELPEGYKLHKVESAKNFSGQTIPETYHVERPDGTTNKAAWNSPEAATENILNSLNQKTKFSDYQLPGGENYREMLLTLPDTRFQLKKLGSGRYAVRDTENNQFIKDAGGAGRSFANVNEAKAEINHLHNINESKNQYKSSHWDEPNVLAHIRMNDRMIDGKKTLHLEEVQSDAHQQGRKKGYIGDPDPNRSGYNLTADNGAVPNFPFKKTWDELALKKALTEAVKNGYDQISWTPGEAQAARYDLSKQISEVHYNKSRQILTAYDKNHDTVISKEAAPDQLSNIIGKDVAEKLIKEGKEDNSKIRGAEDQETYRLKGQDLKVGGQGMKAFYDKMLVDKMNALTKKYGGKVSKSKINKLDEDAIYDKFIKKGYEPHLAEEAMKQELAQGGGDVHVLKITPELREHVLKKGFPLFSAGVPVFTPVSHDPFKENK